MEAQQTEMAGDVVSLRDVLGGWDTRPLSGKRVLVTRTREQASELSAILSELGAEVIEAPFRHGPLQLRERWKLGRALRAKRYDQAIVLPNTWKAALVPFFADTPLSAIRPRDIGLV